MKKAEKEVKAKPQSFKVPSKPKKPVSKRIKSIPKVPAPKKPKPVVEEYEEDELSVEEEISNEVKRFLNFDENKKIYAVIQMSYMYCVVVKKQKVNIAVCKNPNSMQPYSPPEPIPSDIWSAAIVKWGYDDDEILDSLDNISCPIHKVRYVENVKSCFDAIGSV